MNKFFLILCLLNVNIVNAQIITFQATYGSASASEDAFDVIEATNGDFVIAGQSNTFGGNSGLIMRTSPNGVLKWSTLVNSTGERFYKIIEMNPNRFVAVGNTKSGNNDGENILVYCIDSNGNKVWQNILGTNNRDESNGIIKIDNSNMYISAQVNDMGGRGYQYLLAKVDILGNIVSQNIYGRDGTIAYDLILDGGEVVMIGSGNQIFDNEIGGYIQKCNATTHIAENPKFSFLLNRRIYNYNLDKLNSGGYLVSGGNTNSSFSDKKAMISKFDNLGNLQWAFTYEDGNEYFMIRSILTKNQKYYVAMREYEGNNNEAVLAEININNGDVIWAKKYGGNLEDVFLGINQCKDGGIIIAGWSNSFNPSQNRDIYLVKTDSIGNFNNNCTNTSINLTKNTILGLSSNNNAMDQVVSTLATSPTAVSNNITALNDSILCTILEASLEADKLIICENESINFTDKSISNRQISTYNWTFEGGNPATNTAKNPTNITYANSGSYDVTLTITDNALSTHTITVRDYITVLAKVKPIFSLNQDPNCGSITLSGQTPTANFIWKFGDGATSTAVNPKHDYLTSGNYIVTLISGQGTPCADSAEQTVTVTKSRFAAIAPTTPKCANEAITLQATGGNAYSWQPTTGLSNANIANPTCNVSATTTYTCTVISSGGCADTAQCTVVVKTYPSFTAGADVSVCQGNNSTVLNASADADTYSWMPNNAVSNSNIANPNFINNKTTTLILTATKNGCTYTDTLIVTVNDTTADDFSYTQRPCESRVDITINRLTNDIANYTMDYGDGITENVSNAQTISHTYADTGQYTITLSPTNAQNCTKPYSDIITIAPGSTNADIQVPNVFTPNGDNKNDKFMIINENDNCFPKHLLIFNRWGERIYDSGYSRLLSWDGTINYNNVPDGVYLYILEGEGFKKTGTVSVIR